MYARLWGHGGKPDTVLLSSSYSPSGKPRGKQVIAQIVNQLQSRYMLSRRDTSYMMNAVVVLVNLEESRKLNITDIMSKLRPE